MKRVSFKVAKALKEAGYPQDYKNAEDTYTNLNGGIWVKPTYLQVWLWLWREKGIKLYLVPSSLNDITVYLDLEPIYGMNETVKDPEEAIDAALEYLVENDLIK